MDIAQLYLFLKGLSQNNNKDWFDENRANYQSLRNDFVTFSTELLLELGKIDQRFFDLQPSKCLFRINRDIRFSKDKSPYKTNFGLNLNLSGTKELFIGLYLHLEPENSFIAAGTYQPNPDYLALLRQEIDYNLVDFEMALSQANKRFFKSELSGTKLSRPPRGYEQANPAIKWLMHKDFIFEKKLTQDRFDTSQLQKELIKAAEASIPLLDFMLRIRS